jgi:hypothetical protein
MFRGTCSKDTSHIKTFVASDMLWAKIKFAMEYLDFLSSISDEYRFGGIPRLCLWGKLYIIKSGNVWESGDLTSVVVSGMSSRFWSWSCCMLERGLFDVTWVIKLVWLVCSVVSSSFLVCHSVWTQSYICCSFLFSPWIIEKDGSLKKYSVSRKVSSIVT